MEHLKLNPCVTAVILTLMLLSVSNFKAEGQITSPCSSSAMSSFTPCLNFITGSSANGGSPTAQCCNAVKSLMTGSVECACLIVTGNVPFSIPFSRPLAISLPRVCKSGVPLRCQASGVPLPAPGPVLFGPTPAPISDSPIGSPIGHRDSMATAAAAPPSLEANPDEIAPAPAPEPEASPPGAVSLGPVANPGIRPVLNPSSSSNPSYVCPPFLLLIFLGLTLIKSN